MARLSRADQFVTLGAVLVLGAYLVGDLIIGDHPVRDLAWVLAAIVLVAVFYRGRGGGVDTPSWYSGIVLLSGFGVALVAVDQFIADVRRGLGNDLGSVLGIVIYVGAGLMAWGAYLTGRSLPRSPG